MSEDVQGYGMRSYLEAGHELENPDPDPDLLPVLRPDLELQEQTAGHLIRAILKADDSVEDLELKRDTDALAWNQMIQVQKDRVASWRACVRDWMLRNEVTKLQAPWFIVSIGKAIPKIVVDDEEQVIAKLKHLKADKAWESRDRIVKKEFDVIFNSVPGEFTEKKNETTGEVTLPQIAHEEKGEKRLLIRRKEG